MKQFCLATNINRSGIDYYASRTCILSFICQPYPPGVKVRAFWWHAPSNLAKAGSIIVSFYRPKPWYFGVEEVTQPFNIQSYWVIGYRITRELGGRWVSGWPAAQCAYSLLRKTPDITNRAQRRSALIWSSHRALPRCNIIIMWT